MMLDAARRLIGEKGDAFTTQELVKEAGVALQTFYRYFSSKDELLLALIGDMLAEACAGWAEAARDLPDPVARLRFYITSTLETLDVDESSSSAARFIVSTHWRLHRIFPNELADAQKPFVDLLRNEIVAGVREGMLRSADPQSDAWFTLELVRSVYHHYAYASGKTPAVKEDLWRFCLTALGGASA